MGGRHLPPLEIGSPSTAKDSTPGTISSAFAAGCRQVAKPGSRTSVKLQQSATSPAWRGSGASSWTSTDRRAPRAPKRPSAGSPNSLPSIPTPGPPTHSLANLTAGTPRATIRCRGKGKGSGHAGRLGSVGTGQDGSGDEEPGAPRRPVCVRELSFRLGTAPRCSDCGQSSRESGPGKTTPPPRQEPANTRF